ncbi:MAG: ATP-binding protein [Lachnospiraceae bacterium]|nr:ATP-binding protein [Lachnospiraceae bacterium]
MALKNHQYQALMRAYDLRQSMNAHLQSRRIDEVHKEIPEIAEIEHTISTISVASARRLLDGDRTALAELKLQLDELARRKRQLLADHGFPPDYIDSVYTCSDCKDTGYIGNEKCHCFVQASIDLLYFQSNMQGILETENFNTFRLDYYSETITDSITGLTSYQAITRAVEESKDFIRKFSLKYQNLLFYGSTGIGKTFLTHCIAKELLETSHSVLYFSAVQLFDALADTVFSKSEDRTDSIHEEIFNCDLLIIDDLGTEVVNNFVASQLFTCLDTRDSMQKATIISTNLSLQAIREIYSERIFSRLSSQYKIIKLFGDDIRLLKKLHSY